MRLIRYRVAGEDRLGLLEDGGVLRLEGDAACLSSVVRYGVQRHSQRESAAATGLELLAPIRSGRFFCIGLNYQAHVAEAAREAAAKPSVFLRTAASFAGPGEPLWKPRVSSHYDYEGELAFVIGKAGRHIPRARALEHVFGYTCCFEGSVRDFQKHSVGAGKNFERSGAIGPWIVTADEAPAWNAMTLRTRVNGETQQMTKTDMMLFGVPELIEYLSSITTLLPGDVVATGTPSGVGARHAPPLWLKAGDSVEVEIDGIGVLSNAVVEEPQAEFAS